MTCLFDVNKSTNLMEPNAMEKQYSYIKKHKEQKYTCNLVWCTPNS